ncbi:MAG: CHAT domain-containing protein [Bacteroidales bacterium]|nr:CHAT domain-containing protein [Bacteroidales bacterium]
MKKIFLFAILIICSINSFSQNYYQIADSCFNAGDFNNAIANYDKFLQALENSDKGRSLDYAKILVIKSDALLRIGEYQNAVNSCQKADSIFKEGGMVKSDFQLKSFLNSAQGYASMRQNTKSAQYFTLAADLIEYLEGKNKLYADICKNIGYLYFNDEDYEGAVIYLEKAKTIYAMAAHYDFDSYADCVENLATAFFRLQDEQNTMKYTLKFAEIAKQKYGEMSEKYLNAVMNLGIGYLNDGNYTEASEYLLIAAEGFKTIYGVLSPKYARAIYDLSQICFREKDYYGCITYTQAYAKIAEEKDGANSVECAKAAAFLSSIYTELQDFNNAISEGKKAERIFETSSEKDSGYYCLCIASLNSAYMAIGNSKKSLEYNNKLIEFLGKTSSVSSPQYAEQIKNLAIKYSNVANFERAIECFNKALNIYATLYGEKNINYINTLADISKTYLLNGNIDKSKACIAKAYKLCISDSLSRKSTTRANVLNSLAEVCLELGSFLEALKYSLKSVSIFEDSETATSVKYITSLVNAAKSYEKLDSLDKAQEYYLSAYNSAKTGNFDKLFVANITNYLAQTFYEKKDYQKAFSYFYEAYAVYESELKNKFSFMTASERENYWKFFSVVFDNLLAMALTVQNDNALASAYNSLLISKGLLLASELQLTNLIMNSGDINLISKFNMLKNLHRQMSYYSGVDKKKIDSLTTIARRYETDLMNMSGQYGDIINYIKIDYTQVREALGENDVAIEFFFTDKTFGALVLKKQFKTPELVILNSVNYSDPYSTTDMYDDIWKPLEKYFSLDGKIYFSPAGKLHTLAIEYAPIDKKSIIADKYHIYRISSTRNLVNKRNPTNKISAVLFGGVAYDTEVETIQQESIKYASNENTRSIKKSSSAQLFSSGVNAIYLPGTLKEVNNIKSFMDSTSIKTEIITGSQATEESFKSLSGKNYTIIHVATHGFYLDNSNQGDNSLMYSGLLLAGCNNTEMPDEVDDGILTAQEIAFMDLRNTDLLVMSACETGLGKVSSEGVFGLQRGFKKTGVNTMIMSLWQVNDHATQLLMTGFYKNLSNGMSKHDAFLESQKNLRAKKGVTPEHWAAFIMLDGDK